MKHILISSLLFFQLWNCAPKTETNYAPLALLLLSSNQVGTGNINTNEGKATAIASVVSPFSGRSIFPLNLPLTLTLGTVPTTGLTGSATTTNTSTNSDGSTSTNSANLFSGTTSGYTFTSASLNVGTITTEGTCSVTTYIPSIPTDTYTTDGSTVTSGTTTVSNGIWFQSVNSTGTTRNVSGSLKFNAVSSKNYGSVVVDEYGMYNAIKSFQSSGSNYLGYIPSTTKTASCANAQNLFTLLENNYKPMTFTGSLSYSTVSSYSNTVTSATTSSLITSYVTTLNTSDSTGIGITQTSNSTSVSGITLSNVKYSYTGNIVITTPSGSATSTYSGTITITITGTINGSTVNSTYTVTL
jgi:hypothetical protein